MPQFILILSCLFLALPLAGCSGVKLQSTKNSLPYVTDTSSFAQGAPSSRSITSSVPQAKEEVTNIQVVVGEKAFTATLEENAAVSAFIKMMKATPIVIDMSDYSGFEKIGFLEKALPTSSSNITTQAGDIVLYNESQIVIFYGSNTWSYTKLGKIDDLNGFEEALGKGDVSVTFSIK